MQKWIKISLQLCVYGFFFGCDPFSHFMFKFLTEFRGISAEDVSDFFLAQFTYWNLGLLLIFFLVTDMLRYKPLIILSVSAAISYFVTIRWTQGLNPLIAAAFFNGLQTATDVAYFTYIYAKVDKDHYQQVTSNSRSAVLFGRSCGAVLSQLLMMYNVVGVDKLAILSFSSKCIAFCVAVSLPAAKTSIYFYQSKKKDMTSSEIEHRGSNEDKALEYTSSIEIDPMTEHHRKNEEEEEELVEFSWKNAKSLLWSHLKSGYSNNTVQLWSIWWALMQTGFRMVYTYNQPLWHFIEPDREDIYNGFAETGLTLFGALGALLAGKLNQRFVEKWAIAIVIVCSLGEGTLALVAGRTSSVFVSYAAYIVFGAVYYFMVTVCAAVTGRRDTGIGRRKDEQCICVLCCLHSLWSCVLLYGHRLCCGAKNLVQDSFGLIFGINTWFAYLFALIFTVLVVSSNLFSFNQMEQYTIYGCYFFFLSVIFALYWVYKMVLSRKRKAIRSSL